MNRLEFYETKYPDKILWMRPDRKRFAVKKLGSHFETQYAIFSEDNIGVDGFGLDVWFSDENGMWNWIKERENAPTCKEHNEMRRKRMSTVCIGDELPFV